jgi:excisionase family DNA binding protein
MDCEVNTMAEVAERFGVTRQTVARWLDRGHLPSFRFGRVRFIPRVAVDRLLDPDAQVAQTA